MMSANWNRSLAANLLSAAAVLAGVAAFAPSAQAQGRAPAGADESPTIVSAVETLSDEPSGLVKLFAKRLCDVLAKNKVTLSAKLSAIPVLPNAINPNDKDLARIHDTVARIVGPAAAGKTLPPELCADLLDCVARFCPSSDSSMEAAAALARAAQGGLGGTGKQAPSPALAATAIREALYKCFAHVHCAWINQDDVLALKLAAEKDLLGTFATLLACEGEKPDAAALSKQMDEVYRRVSEGAAPGETENAPGADEVLKVLVARLEALRKETGAIAEMAGARKEIAALAGQFLSAVNKEDRKTALACVSAPMAAALEKLPSLRSAVGGAEVEKIEFQCVARFGAPGGKRFLDVQVAVTGKSGTPQQRTARLGLEHAPEGWKIAAP
jgi:hypothetical protein